MITAPYLRTENILPLTGGIVAGKAHSFAVHIACFSHDENNCAATDLPAAIARIVKGYVFLGYGISAIAGAACKHSNVLHCE